MVDSSHFAGFIEKAKQNIDQIKIGLLRHDKNPNDREFLNDIAKSVRSIKKAALPYSLPHISELCQNLENLTTLINEEKKELHQEIIILLASGRDRLNKLLFELDTVQGERSKVKDLVRRIQQQIDDYNEPDTPAAEEPALSNDDIPETQVATSPQQDKSSLLPEEIINKDYDRELFQIFIEQLQENLSLLRTLTDSYTEASNKDLLMGQCSNLIGKLQSSANYMGYDQLAAFYLQWVAELEMAGVDLSIGTPVSFDFMDQKIKKIVDLFPEIEDRPADQALMEGRQTKQVPSESAAEPEKTDIAPAEIRFDEISSSSEEEDEKDPVTVTEPIAALSGTTFIESEETRKVEAERTPSPEKKESRAKKIVEIDGSFLEEEKESENYDKELFEIFVQQLRENISQLQQLTDNFPGETNKSSSIDKCSNLVGKLQSSANYMGYERLAEYYLQWIAELEMTGVEMSLGDDISFDFMQEKIDRINELFPADETEGTPVQNKATRTVATPLPVKRALANEPEEEEEPLAEGIEPIAGIAIEERPGNEIAAQALPEEITADPRKESENDDFSEMLDEKLESFFTDIEEPEAEENELETSFMEIASLSEEEPLSEKDTALADVPVEIVTEPALAEKRQAEIVAGRASVDFGDALEEKLESFFGDFKEAEEKAEVPDIPAAPVASISDEIEDLPASALEEITEPAFFTDDSFEDEDKETLADEIEPVAEALVGKTDDSADDESAYTEEKAEADTFSEAVDEKLESFFADIAEPKGAEEMESSFMEVASLSDEEPTEEPIAFTAEPPAAETLELIDEDEDAEDQDQLAEGLEPVAALFEEEESEPRDAAPALTEIETAAVTEEPAGGDFAQSVDEKLESFFTDLETLEAEETPPAAEAGPVAGLFAEEKSATEETALASVEATLPDITEEPAAGDFARSVDEKLEGFFTDMETLEAEETPPAAEVEPAAGLFAEEKSATEETALPSVEATLPDITEEPAAGDFARPVDEKLEGFFTDMETLEAEETPPAAEAEPVAGLFAEEESAPEEALPEQPADEPVEDTEGTDFTFESIDEQFDIFFTEEEETGYEEISSSEAAEPDAELPDEEAEELAGSSADITGAGGPVSDELPVDVDALMETEELAAEESVEYIPVDSGDLSDDFEFTEAGPEEVLSDEELLEEIEGPTVGEKIASDTVALPPDISITEDAVSAMSEDDISDEELFKKLEDAIAVETDEKAHIEELSADTDFSEEAGIGEESPDSGPVRQELFQKLSHALQSLDEETGEFEDTLEDETEEAEPEFDDLLFDKLASALETPPDQADVNGSKPIDKVMEEIFSSTPADAVHIEPPIDTAPRKLAASEIMQMINMDTDKVDHLIDRLGELNANRSTLTKLFSEMNELHHHYLKIDPINRKDLTPFKELAVRLGDTAVSLDRLSSEIRDGVLKVRMAPISLLFDRYPDFIGNMAEKSGKQVEVEMNGQDTEIEKTVIDEISEPLTHIISNAMEHGIETVAERTELGKEETGKIQLEAYQEDNEIVIEIMDDGRGIDLKKVKATALEQGLFNGDELLAMSDKDLKRLILNPDFSTVGDQGSRTENVGEGLHIVNTCIDKLNGSIDIRSKTGKGTIIQIRIPLKLLVIKALKIQVGDETLALPVNNVEEILKVRNTEIFKENGSMFININDSKLPLYRASDIFNITPADDEVHNEQVFIVTLQAAKRSFGLIVDKTAGIEEVVIKPLGELLREKSGFSGVTIINDGNISLVPDVSELIRTEPEPEQGKVAEESVF